MTTEARPSELVADPGIGAGAPTGRRFPIARLVTRPIAIAAALIGLWVYLSNQQLDSIEERALAWSLVRERLIEHLKLMGVSTAIVIAIAVPLGILVTRTGGRFVAPLVLGLGNIGLAVPTIGLLVLAAVLFDIGFTYAVGALVLYSLLPVLRNTVVGLQQIDPSLVEAGRGMGMSRLAVLLRVELPLAVPVILAGVGTALVFNVGSATLATYTGAGGLGAIIDTGLSLQRDPVLITGCLLTAALALTVDWLAGLAESLLRPRGL